MKNSNYNRVLLVCGSDSTRKRLHAQLENILPDEVGVDYFLVEENKKLPKGKWDAIFSSQEVYDEFFEKYKDVAFGNVIVGTRTVINEHLDVILSMPRDQKVLFVTDSKIAAQEGLADLQNVGFDFLNLVPYYPGSNLDTSKFKIALTMGEVKYVPKGIEAVYDIGAREFDLDTVVRIIAYYNLLGEKLSQLVTEYRNNALDFAKRISNVAYEAGKVIDNVHSKLVGNGYYAKHDFDSIVGESEAIRKVKNIASKLARTDLSVLIEGDNGSGKELFASAIHNASKRKDKPFVAINFSALPDQLVESELFGYEEGAFTGAKKGGKIGLFQQAEGGTLFLDEIGDISPKIQAKLLRVLEEREILKVGGNKNIPVNVRIVAATNRNLQEMIEEKTFREDLYYRLKEGYLVLPELKHRREDIPLLVDYWLCEEFRSGEILSEEVREYLQNEDWPGNVRQLRNTIKYAVAVCEGDIITMDDLPMEHYRKNNCHFSADEMSVLEVIYQLIKDNQVAGRNKIYNALKENGEAMSEYAIRKHLQSLKNEGYIRQEEGKYGFLITAKGMDILG